MTEPATISDGANAHGFRKLNDEVYFAQGDLTSLAAADLAFLKTAAVASPLHRARLCVHSDPGAPLHEMLIVHARGLYVRPHKHLFTPRSYHMIEGRMTVFVFADDGRLMRTIRLAEPGAGELFYCRFPPGIFYSVQPDTEFALFHETGTGPFDPKNVVHAPWAPEDTDEPGARRFLKSLAVARDAGGSER